jgi:LPS-assembly lipoprotein
MAAALGGCGFTPAYAPQGGASRLQNRVLVEELTTSDGYVLVRELETRLGRAQAPAYGLAISLTTEDEGMAITTDNDTTRFDVIGRAKFALRDLATGNVLTSGEVESFTGYSTTGTTVSTLAAEKDARERLMVILSDKITIRLLAFAPTLVQ